MRFPIRVKYRRLEAIIYAKSGKYPYYRLAYRAAGKRVVRSFAKYTDARAAAETRLRELATGNQTVALSAKEASDALLIRDSLEEFRRTTGQKVTAVQAVNGYLDARKLLPMAHNLTDAVRDYLRTVEIVQRKPLAEAVDEFCAVRTPKGIATPGKRSALNPVYVADTARHLREFACAFPGSSVADITRNHLDKYIGAHGTLSAKSRNHIRSTLRMFCGWCVRHDYLSTGHRLMEAEGLLREPMDTAPIDHYRPQELRTLLDASTGPMRAVIALQALAGLRLQEALRLDWREVFGIPGHVEVSSAKSKTRQRRLVEVCAALEQWLKPYAGNSGKVSPQNLNVYTQAFTTLRKSLKIPPRRNGLRHGFVTYHFATHSNENQTAAQAGNSPAMIHAHYKGLATKAEAEKWFAVVPK